MDAPGEVSPGHMTFEPDKTCLMPPLSTCILGTIWGSAEPIQTPIKKWWCDAYICGWLSEKEWWTFPLWHLSRRKRLPCPQWPVRFSQHCQFPLEFFKIFGLNDWGKRLPLEFAVLDGGLFRHQVLNDVFDGRESISHLFDDSSQGALGHLLSFHNDQWAKWNQIRCSAGQCPPLFQRVNLFKGQGGLKIKNQRTSLTFSAFFWIGDWKVNWFLLNFQKKSFESTRNKKLPFWAKKTMKWFV